MPEDKLAGEMTPEERQEIAQMLRARLKRQKTEMFKVPLSHKTVFVRSNQMLERAIEILGQEPFDQAAAEEAYYLVEDSEDLEVLSAGLGIKVWRTSKVDTRS